MLLPELPDFFRNPASQSYIKGTCVEEGFPNFLITIFDNWYTTFAHHFCRNYIVCTNICIVYFKIIFTSDYLIFR